MTQVDADLPTQDEYFAQLFNELNAMVTHLEAIQEKYFLVDTSYDRIPLYNQWGCYYDGSEFVITDMPQYKDLRDEKKFTEKYDNSLWTRARNSKYFLPSLALSEALVGGVILMSNFASPIPIAEVTAFMACIIGTMATVVLTIVNFPPTKTAYNFYSVRDFFMTEIDDLEDLRGYHSGCKKLVKDYLNQIARDAPTELASKIINNQKFIETLPSLMDVVQDDKPADWNTMYYTNYYITPSTASPRRPPPPELTTTN